MAEVKFPTEVVDLPSTGLLYPKDSPLSSGQIEIKYMTAREEDILTSANLIKKGIVVEKLIEALIENNNWENARKESIYRLIDAFKKILGK